MAQSLTACSAAVGLHKHHDISAHDSSPAYVDVAALQVLLPPPSAPRTQSRAFIFTPLAALRSFIRVLPQQPLGLVETLERHLAEHAGALAVSICCTVTTPSTSFIYKRCI